LQESWRPSQAIRAAIEVTARRLDEARDQGTCALLGRLAAEGIAVLTPRSRSSQTWAGLPAPP
jgi:hypothetical protein